MKKENHQFGDLKIGVVGLGYVGLPLAHLFSSQYNVVGYDVDKRRVDSINKGIDVDEMLRSTEIMASLNSSLVVTTDESLLCNCNFYVVAVPTNVNADMQLDLLPLQSATKTISKYLAKGDIVVYESTVYPGFTEKKCVPLLENCSGLRYNKDFFVGFSPERINPGDKEHSVGVTPKVTSGSTPETADRVDAIYAAVLQADTCKVSTIQTAEAAKLVENTQRDMNIAFMNEMLMTFNTMGIDLEEVIKAASTKWNFVNVRPGLVGGHCIGIDPYFLIQCAHEFGTKVPLVEKAREINEGMAGYHMERVLGRMAVKGIDIKGAKILLLGFAFKKNCPDTRNTKVAEVYRILTNAGAVVTVYDPWVDSETVETVYGITVNTEQLAPGCRFEAVVYCVGHKIFRNLRPNELLVDGGVIYDITGSFLKRLDI